MNFVWVVIMQVRLPTNVTSFLGPDFLLSNETSRRLYYEHAAPQPILDFHSHLSAKDIAEDRRFDNLYEIWLEGDHYKWRAMRANGIAERYCTGDASPYDKFCAWARTVPYTLRNPLYHWTYLELQRYFGIADLLDESTALAIWERANAALPSLSAQTILQKFKVEVLYTTDDPAGDLTYHRTIAASGLATRVLPTFRPDRALAVHRPAEFNPWLARLSAAANTEISSLASLLDALRRRHGDFHALGCRLSDHGLDRCYADPCSEESAAAIFARARDGKTVSQDEQERFASFMMLYFARLDAERGWTKQLHLGALRNVNTHAYHIHGPDTGFDAIGSFPQLPYLSRYLDLLRREESLPQMILYNANPADTFPFAVLAGSFQEEVPGKIQLGSAWWFLDQKEGIQAQLNALSNAGLLSRFVGMVTDSRSFLSFPRHEYFRRILCDLLGNEMERGELPCDFALVGQMVKDICYGNARQYLRLGAGG
jgi:glucuronate isomerase